jgi:hypothetical protein
MAPQTNPVGRSASGAHDSRSRNCSGLALPCAAHKRSRRRARRRQDACDPTLSRPSPVTRVGRSGQALRATDASVSSFSRGLVFALIGCPWEQPAQLRPSSRSIALARRRALSGLLRRYAVSSNASSRWVSQHSTMEHEPIASSTASADPRAASRSARPEPFPSPRKTMASAGRLSRRSAQVLSLSPRSVSDVSPIVISHSFLSTIRRDIIEL